jgi:hypothetical protein
MEKYPNRKYLGEPFYNSVRYAYTFDNRLQAGLTAEKDAGEPMWNKHNKGYDFYSFHLLAKDLGWLKTLVAGDYKMSFGQGLVASNDFAPGRNAIVAQAERRGYGFRRHFSTNENDFFRGMATTARWDNIYLSLFYSYKRMDATMSDSLTASSIKTDGLHRLPGERDKTGVLPMQTFGGNMSYIAPKLCLGLTAIRYSFGDYSVIPADRPYNVFYFRGNENLNMSVDYKIKSRKLKFYGETAISANKAVATLNAVQLTPASHLSFLLLYRYYAEQYQAYFGNAFSQNTAVQNEQGLYAAMQISPFAYWKVSAYADFFRFPWLKYGVDAPSDGKEYMLQVDYTRMEDASFYLRYKYRQREKNQTLPPVNNTQVEPYGQHKVRFQAQYALRSCLFRTSVEGVAYSETGKQSSGMMAEQSLAWKPSLPLQADINVAYFHTDDYDTRLGSHEKNIPYVFNRPQLYGHGLRMSAIARYDISDNTNISAKLAHTHYFDREVTGTGTEEIEGNVKTDICILVRHKF